MAAARTRAPTSPCPATGISSRMSLADQARPDSLARSIAASIARITRGSAAFSAAAMPSSRRASGVLIIGLLRAQGGRGGLVPAPGLAVRIRRSGGVGGWRRRRGGGGWSCGTVLPDQEAAAERRSVALGSGRPVGPDEPHAAGQELDA